MPRTPSFRLDGKVALVTGGSRGLGLAAGVSLAQAGARVILASRTEQEVAEAASAIRSEGGDAAHLVLDVLDLDLVETTVSRAGPFDILVNNAGTNRPMPMPKVTQDDFDAIIDLNLRGAYFVAQQVVNGMIAHHRQGSIINISSQMGHVGAANRTVYCASKHAIEGLTKAMAVELGAHGIRVNSICPTFILTEMTQSFFESSEFRQAVLSKIALGRLGRVEDIMGAVIFLASEASGLITGSSIMVDGGWTAE